jgi:hypothetical protein
MGITMIYIYIYPNLEIISMVDLQLVFSVDTKMVCFNNARQVNR